MDNTAHSNRLIFPRWRALSRTPAHELKSSMVRLVSPQSLKLSLEESNEYRAWTNRQSIENASEVLEVALLIGEEKKAEDIALWILRRAQDIQPDVVRLARHIIGQIKPFEEIHVSRNLQQAHDLRVRAIRLLKSRVNLHPRDSISFAELSRLYFLMGQHEKAEQSMEMALRIAPDNRFILRNAAQLFENIDDAGKALAFVWRSDAVKVDPWIQAAEIALADRCETAPRFGTKSLTSLLNVAAGRVQTSELAVGLASLELKNGSALKRVKKLLRTSAERATENALAQILWVEHEADVSIDADRLASVTEAAHEAQARVYYDSKNYSGSLVEAQLWLNDQPFSVDAAREYMFTSGVHLGDYESAAAVGKEALRIHPRDPALINAQFHALAMDGQIQEAIVMLKKLEEFSSNEDILPFIHAGRGLLDYKTGDIEAGRLNYFTAVETAKKRQNQGLAVNANIYWLEQEAAGGFSSREDVLSVAKKIDRVLESKKSFVKGLEATWETKRACILNYTAEHNNVSLGEVRDRDGRKVSVVIDRAKVPKHMESLLRAIEY